MIWASVIYALVTVVLAGVDALRIHFAGLLNEENIDHKVSTRLAVTSAAITTVCVLLFIDHFCEFKGWKGDVVWTLLMAAVYTATRLVFYDPSLNLFRGLRIDYVSPTSSSKIEQDLARIPFWHRRAIGVVLWLLAFLVYKLIFKR